MDFIFLEIIFSTGPPESCWGGVGGLSTTRLVSLPRQLDVPDSRTEKCLWSFLQHPSSPWIGLHCYAKDGVLAARLWAWVDRHLLPRKFPPIFVDMSCLKRPFGCLEHGSVVVAGVLTAISTPSMASSKQRGSFYELFFTNCQGIVFFWRHSTDMEFSSAHLQIPCRVCETANHNPSSPCAPHENTHWLFVLMLGPNITIVSGSLPHSSLDGHLGEFVYNVCFEWKFKIPRPQDVRLNCGLNSILHFSPQRGPAYITTVNSEWNTGERYVFVFVSRISIWRNMRSTCYL